MNRSKFGLGLRQASTVVALIGSLTSGPAVAAASGKTDVRTSHLRCDYLTEPLGQDDLHPRISWQMESARPGAAHTAYQIAVASSPEMLRRNHPDIWDSGRVASGISVGIPYGRAAASQQALLLQYLGVGRAWSRFDGQSAELVRDGSADRFGLEG